MQPHKPLTSLIPAVVLVLFVFLVLGITVYVKYPWFVQIFASERGAGTWMSSMLLCCAATVALLLGTLSKNRFLWFIFACILLFLSADDAFMIHEYAKQCILHYLFQDEPQRMGCIGDLPVVAAGIAGAFLALRFFFITQLFHIRLLIAGMVICGGLSVAFDVLYINTVVEEILKLASELICLVWVLEEFRYRISANRARVGTE